MNDFSTITLTIFIVVFLLEKVFPYRKGYHHQIRHLSRNATLAIANALITNLFSLYITVHAYLYVLEQQWGLLNQVQIGSWMTFILAFLLLDVWMYYWHRINHTIPFLWRFHQVHHNDTEMDVSTAFRFHPIEVFFSTIIHIILVLLIGLKVEHYIIYKIIFVSNVYVHHSNVAFPETIDRILRWIIVTPNMHRVHHSSVKNETDSNYCSVFSIWDRIFGSYKERDTHDIEYGLNKFREDQWQTVKSLFTLPFRKD